MSDPELKRDELMQYEKLHTTVIAHLDELTDEFYFAAGAHFIIELLTAAGDDAGARRLLNAIRDEFVREQAAAGFVGGAQAALRRFREIRAQA